MDEGMLQKNKWVRTQHGLPLAGRRSTAPAGDGRALQMCGQCGLPKETLLGSREAGHIGTSEKVSQVVAPVGN